MNDWVGGEKKREERWVTVSGSLVRRFTRRHQGGSVGEDNVVNISVANLHVSVLPFSVDDQEHTEKHGGYEQRTETHPLEKKGWIFQPKWASPEYARSYCAVTKTRDLHLSDSSVLSEPRDMSLPTSKRSPFTPLRSFGFRFFDRKLSGDLQGWLKSPVCDPVGRSAIQPMNGSISFFFFFFLVFVWLSG